MERVQDLRLTAFANKISSAVDDAVDSGMALDEIVSVAADYGRGTYGNRYLKGLAQLVLARAGEPMSTVIRETKR